MSGRLRLTVVTLTAALVFVGVGGLASDASAQSGSPISADRVVIDVEIGQNGDAVWELEYHYLLTTENRTDGFERLRDKILQNGDSYESEFQADFNRTVALARNRTGRRMTTRNVSVEVNRQPIPQDTGIVIHRLNWTGFAEANDTHVVAGDAIRKFYIGPNTELTIHWPSVYATLELAPAPDRTTDHSATWEGGQFESGEPRLVFVDESLTGNGVPIVLVGIGSVIVVLLGLAVGIAYLQWDGSASSLSLPSDEPSGPPPELLSNEERVKYVLEANSGRVKQQTIAEQCDWGESKTSKVISELHDEDVIERFRIGRENVIALPEHADLTDDE